MEKIKGMITCKVCGRDFPLIGEEHYLAADKDQTGIAAAINRTEPEIYDAIDCPHCGCQNILQIRKRDYCPCDYGICDEYQCECNGEEEPEKE